MWSRVVGGTVGLGVKREVICRGRRSAAHLSVPFVRGRGAAIAAAASAKEEGGIAAAAARAPEARLLPEAEAERRDQRQKQHTACQRAGWSGERGEAGR